MNRVSGKTGITNVVGDPLSITGYSILSENGLLSESGWTSLTSQNFDGWGAVPARNQALAERLDRRSRDGRLLTDADLVGALEDAADATVGFYQSVIGTTNKPPAKPAAPTPTNAVTTAGGSKPKVIKATATQ